MAVIRHTQNKDSDNSAERFREAAKAEEARKSEKAFQDALLRGQQKKSFDIDKAEADLMKFIVANAKNVNPLKETDSSAMTNMYNTLISFKQAKIQINTMEQLLQAINELSNIGSYAQLLGKEIKVEGNRVMVRGGKAEINFQIPDDAVKPVLEILDAGGNVKLAQALTREQASFIWVPRDRKDDDYYKDMTFRIVEDSDPSKRDIAADKKYYTTAREVLQEVVAGERKRYVMTGSGSKIEPNDIAGIKQPTYSPAVATNLHTLREDVSGLESLTKEKVQFNLERKDEKNAEDDDDDDEAYVAEKDEL